MAFGLATAFPTAARRPGVAPAGAKRVRKLTAAASVLTEATVKKKMKKAKGAPCPRLAPRAATLTAPTASASARAVPTAGKKKRGHQVLDEMPTSAQMNTAKFLASLQSSSVVGLDELNYDSFWDHSMASQDMGQEVNAEEVVVEDGYSEEEVAEEEEVVEVTEASTKVPKCRTQNYNQIEDINLCDAWCAISMDATMGTDQIKIMFWVRII
ncbi:Lysosomal Pro-X carboxypeptidase [Hordeum vulgare]|nr:Lysosomal Pro-X carboxypeptidase [Hordeum vulgare]